MNNPVPEGYMEDAQGRLVALEKVSELDLLRNSVVQEVMGNAKMLAATVAMVKDDTIKSIDAFAQLSAEQYKADIRGKNGNVTLYSFDGRYKIVRCTDEFIAFDERLQAAKALVDECLKKWSRDSGPEIRTIVTDAFQVDRVGRINTKRILALKRLKIDDETWRQAMQAIADSVQVVNSKSYIRFYERQPDGSYKQLALNFSA